MIPAPGAHGGDAERVARALGVDPRHLLDLSQSLNPFAPDPATVVAGHLDTIGRYPDSTAATETLAAAIGVDPSEVLITNGGSEAIALVADLLGGGVQAEPEFGLHPRSETGPRWRSDPHSPTGVLAHPTDRADVWDEAFYPLATGTWTAGRDGVVVGSLTKTFACPGLRLGYVVADEGTVSALRTRQPEWPVSTLALAVAVDLVETADLPAWQRDIATARAELVAVLSDRGLPADAVDAPWVLVAAPGLRDRLAPEGVLVRDCTSFGLPGTVRIAVPDPDGLDRLCAALDRVIGP